MQSFKYNVVKNEVPKVIIRLLGHDFEPNETYPDANGGICAELYIGNLVIPEKFDAILKDQNES